MIERGTQARMALGRAARLRVIERFPLQSIVTRYEALYEELFAQEATEQFSTESIEIARSRASS
jgi:hypothetical protein